MHCVASVNQIPPHIIYRLRENLEIFFFKIPPADSGSIYSHETIVGGTAIDSPLNENPSIALATPVVSPSEENNWTSGLT
jgi:hypothetical protein